MENRPDGKNIRMETRPDGNSSGWKTEMITVGTPGLGVRHPDGKSSGWKIIRMENR
jgi:hypothetical protein